MYYITKKATGNELISCCFPAEMTALTGFFRTWIEVFGSYNTRCNVGLLRHDADYDPKTHMSGPYTADFELARPLFSECYNFSGGLK